MFHMTIREAIERTDALLFNTYTTEDKILWLSGLEWDIVRNVMDLHRGYEGAGFLGFDRDTDPDTVLLAQPPYDEMYLTFLESRIHYHNGETDRYNVSAAAFNRLFDSFARNYRRTHMPLSPGRFRF
jgi:hypothetical protein